MLVCCLQPPSFFFLDSYEIYNSESRPFWFAYAKMKAHPSSLKDFFFFFPTDSCISFYHQKYCLGERVLCYCIIDLEHGIGNKEDTVQKF